VDVVDEQWTGQPLPQRKGSPSSPCKYNNSNNNNNIITVGLVPGERRKRNFNIRFTRNTPVGSLLLFVTRQTFYLVATVDVIFMRPALAADTK